MGPLVSFPCYFDALRIRGSIENLRKWAGARGTGDKTIRDLGFLHIWQWAIGRYCAFGRNGMRRSASKNVDLVR